MGGLFLSFEGIDGCGKSTQADLCFEALKKLNLSVIKTREPGGEAVAERIREILLFSEDDVVDSAEALLYAASRAQHVAKVIRPSLESSKIVVCDRFVHSSVAYQGYGLGIDVDTIWKVNQLAMGDIFPDLVFLFDLDIKEAKNRSKKRGDTPSREINTNNEIIGTDRIEERDANFYQRVRNGFLEMATKDKRIVVLDANEPKETLHDKVMEIIRVTLNT
ncbi:MAG: dTMP kinase [Firmicutes bacterium]|nr:dTMP kinase [Bacillota bacterium]MDD4264246.1 dTMP kinase [Bacillota bacterium]MDD4694193.1 dTMP kinase [Bacillota bacterium]